MLHVGGVPPMLEHLQRAFLSHWRFVDRLELFAVFCGRGVEQGVVILFDLIVFGLVSLGQILIVALVRLVFDLEF